MRMRKGTLLRNVSDDPHVLKQPDDPVFDPVIARDVEWKGITVQHTGKARRGNGNDLTADPKKLCMIGAELDELNQNITDVVNSCEVMGGKQTARKEKNKLTSRVCRLKKKAQHEANKIKLQGLTEQHSKSWWACLRVFVRLIDWLITWTCEYSITDFLIDGKNVRGCFFSSFLWYLLKMRKLQYTAVLHHTHSFSN